MNILCGIKLITFVVKETWLVDIVYNHKDVFLNNLKGGRNASRQFLTIFKVVKTCIKWNENFNSLWILGQITVVLEWKGWREIVSKTTTAISPHDSNEQDNNKRSIYKKGHPEWKKMFPEGETCNLLKKSKWLKTENNLKRLFSFAPSWDICREPQ